MKLEDIEIRGGDGNESSKIISALEKLPEGTVKGISSYGFFSATLLRNGVIKMGDFDPTSSDEIEISVPRGAVEVIHSKRKVSFNYEGNRYEIYR